ncbi:MAG: EamA family transporter [Candidatus Paceibacterota bacterium]|jgi:drug/metabolite transporter (DMT)-like permease
MTWFFIALGSVFLWSIVTYLDKFIIERFIKNRGVGSLILFSALFAGVVIPIIAVINPRVLLISSMDICLLGLSGILGSLAIIFYLHALEYEDTSLVIPLFQLIPVFSYVLAYIFLRETLSGKQIVAGLIVVIGAIILTLDIEEDKKIKVKMKPLLLMGFSSLAFSLMDVLYKFVSVDQDFWLTQFWHYVGLFIFGIILYLCVKNYRQEFHRVIKSSPLSVVGANVGGEILQVAANMMNNFALLLAPVVLVTLVSSYMPLIVFVMGLIFTLTIPRFITEKVSRKHILHKSLAISIVVIGSILLYT